MVEPLAIQYREFYDVPRLFITVYDGVTYLFDGSFDEASDDYPDKYAVSILPPLQADDLAGSWEKLSSVAVHLVGSVSVSSVQFDSSRRKLMEGLLLRSMLSSHPQTIEAAAARS